MNNLAMKLATLSMRNVLIGAALVAGLYFYMVYDDGSAIDAKIIAADASIRTEEAKAKDSELALKEVEMIRSNVGALSDQFKVASQRLPADMQMSDIIKDVDNVARESGVTVRSREPMASKQKDFLEEIPLSIKIEGSFSQITLFLYKIATQERIMRVDQFSMMSTGNFPWRLNFQGEISSYRFIPPKTETKSDK